MPRGEQGCQCPPVRRRPAEPVDQDQWVRGGTAHEVTKAARLDLGETLVQAAGLRCHTQRAWTILTAHWFCAQKTETLEPAERPAGGLFRPRRGRGASWRTTSRLKSCRRSSASIARRSSASAWRKAYRSTRARSTKPCSRRSSRRSARQVGRDRPNTKTRNVSPKPGLARRRHSAGGRVSPKRRGLTGEPWVHPC